MFAGKKPLCATCMTKRYGKRSSQRRANGEHKYSDTKWVAQRSRLLAGQPPCVDCGQPATDLDHVPPRRLLLAAQATTTTTTSADSPDARMTNVDDPVWLHPRCKPCHSWRTMHIDLPLLHRLAAGEDATTLCNAAMADTRRRPTATDRQEQVK